MICSGSRQRSGGGETSEGFEVEAEQQVCTRTPGPGPAQGASLPFTRVTREGPEGRL